MVFGFVLIGQLSIYSQTRNWKAPLKILLVIIVLIGIAAEASEFGVRYGHWNELIVQRAHRLAAEN